MDLQTVKDKIQKGEYKSKEMFASDIKLIFANAMKYNDASSFYHKYADQLSKVSDQLLESIMPEIADLGATLSAAEAPTKKLKVK